MPETTREMPFGEELYRTICDLGGRHLVLCGMAYADVQTFKRSTRKQVVSLLNGSASSVITAAESGTVEELASTMIQVAKGASTSLDDVRIGGAPCLGDEHLKMSRWARPSFWLAPFSIPMMSFSGWMRDERSLILAFSVGGVATLFVLASTLTEVLVHPKSRTFWILEGLWVLCFVGLFVFAYTGAE